MARCKSGLKFGDDFGDNETTFYCQLEEGHKGRHKQKGAMYGKYPYTITWTGDMSKDEQNEQDDYGNSIECARHSCFCANNDDYHIGWGNRIIRGYQGGCKLHSKCKFRNEYWKCPDFQLYMMSADLTKYLGKGSNNG